MARTIDEKIALAKKEETLARSREAVAAAKFKTQQLRRAGEVMALTGSYTAARRTRLRTGGGPRIRGASADAHRDTLTLQELRAGATERERNDSSARAMVARLIDMVIADGFTLQADTDDEGWNTAIEDLHADWCDRLDGTGADVRGLMTHDEQAADCVRRACFDGDIVFLQLSQGSLQGVEAPRLMNPAGRMANTQTLCNGVEMDSLGRPTVFHIAEWLYDGSSPSNSTTPRPANRCLFYVNPMQLTVGSTRGEPQLQAAVQRLERIGRYDVAVTAAAEMAACFGLVRTSENPAQKQADWLGETVTPGEGVSASEKQVQLAPGLIQDEATGTLITQIKPEQPTTAYGEFILTQMMFAATDLGLPLFLAMLDGRNVNLASMRAMMQIVFRSYHRWQRSVMTRLYRPAYLWKVAQWIRTKELPFREDWMKHSWTVPPPPMMDPLTEIEAGIAAVNARQKAPSRVMAELHGLDSSREFKKIAADLKTMKILGIEPIQKPGSATPVDGSNKGVEAKPQSETDQPDGEPSGDGGKGS